MHLEPTRGSAICSGCGETKHRIHDIKPAREWRHLDAWHVPTLVRSVVRRVRCRHCGVRVEQVPWARTRSRFTHEFEADVLGRARDTSISGVCRQLGLHWTSVMRLIERWVEESAARHFRRPLKHIGVDEISYGRGQHKYLTVVWDHDRSTIVWIGRGRDRDTLDGFFTKLGPKRAHRLVAVTMEVARRAITRMREGLQSCIRSVEQMTEIGATTFADSPSTTSEFLDGIGRVLASSLDYERTLRNSVLLTVPHLGDWAIAAVGERDGSIRVVGIAADAEKQHLAAELERCVPDMSARGGLPHVVRTLTSVVYSDITDEMFELRDGVEPPIATRDPFHLEVSRMLGMRSYMAVPLVARGRALGAMMFVSSRDPHHYGPSEVAVAEELARRAAGAIENARLYRDAQDAIRERDEFLSVASHELRTPLTSLRLAAQLMENAGTVPPDQAKLLDVVCRQSEQLGRLIESLLHMSRPATRWGLEREELDLAVLVRRVEERFAFDLTRAGCALVVKADAPVIGRWDRAQLDQVVTNMLSNAFKFGAGKPIELGVEALNGMARLTVCDHGIGIPRELHSKIFDPFQRAVSARHYGGLGIGLFVVRRIVEQHRGSVHVDSVPGMGATFIVELPRGSDEQ